MRHSISSMTRGTWRDYCKKMIYIDVWSHVERHAREKQMEEDARASREASDRATDIFRKGKGCK